MNPARYIIFAGSYRRQDSFRGGKGTELSCCNCCPCCMCQSIRLHRLQLPLQARPAEQHWCCVKPSPCGCTKGFQGSSWWWFPALALAVLIPALLHRQSCVSTRAHTIIAVLAKEKNSTTLTSIALW